MERKLLSKSSAIPLTQAAAVTGSPMRSSSARPPQSHGMLAAPALPYKRHTCAHPGNRADRRHKV